MYYGNIKPVSIENGYGVRVSLFVSGCRNCCKGCFSSQTWDFCYGKEFTQDTMNEILRDLEPSYVQGITILGGEPMEPENQECVLNIIQNIRTKLPDKDIWMYSGFTLDEMLGDNHSRCKTEFLKDILNNLDVLVDGKFVEGLKNVSLKFRGSSNQRVIDMKRTMETGGKEIRILCE